MANVGSGTSGQTYIGAGNGKSGLFANIGTNSGLTNHGVVVSQGNSGFAATSAGTANSVLISNVSTNPTFSTTGQIQFSSIGIGATPGASGLTFDGTNLLGNYSVGTFTPTAFGGSTAGTTTPSINIGRYTRIGNRVFVQIRIAWSAATGTGQIQIGTLPIIPISTAGVFWPCSIEPAISASTVSVTAVPYLVANNSNTILAGASYANATGLLTVIAIASTGDYALTLIYEV